MASASTRATAQRRPERTEDQPFLFHLFSTARSAPLLALDQPLRDALIRHQFAGQAATYRALHPCGRFDIVELRDQAVGRIVTDLSDAALTLVDLVLLPRWRRQGLGTALLVGLQAEACVLGVEIRLTVATENGAARRLYGRLGFWPATTSDTGVAMRWTPE